MFNLKPRGFNGGPRRGSWLSSRMGWDKHPAQLAAANAVGHAVEAGVEASVPGATAIINTAETIGNNLGAGPPQTLKDVYALLIKVDPTAVIQIEAAVASVVANELTKNNVPAVVVAATVADLDNLIGAELAKFGTTAPTTTTS